MISRIKMPQVGGELYPELIEWLHLSGCKTFRCLLRPQDVRFKQKPDPYIPALFDPVQLEKPVIVSSDLWMLDGHHRRAAHIAWHTEMPTIKLSWPFWSALALLNSWPLVSHKEDMILT